MTYKEEDNLLYTIHFTYILGYLTNKKPNHQSEVFF